MLCGLADLHPQICAGCGLDSRHRVQGPWRFPWLCSLAGSRAHRVRGLRSVVRRWWRSIGAFHLLCGIYAYINRDSCRCQRSFPANWPNPTFLSPGAICQPNSSSSSCNSNCSIAIRMTQRPLRLQVKYRKIDVIGVTSIKGILCTLTIRWRRIQRSSKSTNCSKQHYVVKTTAFRTGSRSCQMARFTGLELSHNPSQKQRAK
jgi:hypothetical protein